MTNGNDPIVSATTAAAPPATADESEKKEEIPPKPASEIVVHQYRQILIWPVLLKPLKGKPSLDDWIARFVGSERGDKSRDRQGWREEEMLPPQVTPSPLDTPDDCNPCYEEMVYFHPFVRDFLYGDGDSDHSRRPLRRLRRYDIDHMRIELTDDAPIILQVPRVELYLCKPSVALLVVEVALPLTGPGEKPLTLDRVLTLQSRIRQLYPPFFYGNGAAGNCPQRVAWLKSTADGHLTEVVASDFEKGRCEFARFAHQAAEPPVSAHWQWLLEPLRPYVGQRSKHDSYQQLVDDRIPGMTYLAVDEARAIESGDFDRLAFCDTGGKPPFPYAQQFLEERRADHRYDRFWRPTADGDANNELQLNVRYLCSGYQFVVVGSQSNGFFAGLIGQHFRRHYFRMGLLAHYHHAALLKFADEMSESIKQIAAADTPAKLGESSYRDSLVASQLDFLAFRSNSWFNEVSNQLQGRELWDWWSGLLENERLFHEVEQTSERLYEAVTEYEARQLTRAQVHLAAVATVFLPWTTLFAFVAINAASAATSWLWGGLSIAVFYIVFWRYSIKCWLFEWGREEVSFWKRQWRRFWSWISKKTTAADENP